jgi:hypothetical protein
MRLFDSSIEASIVNHIKDGAKTASEIIDTLRIGNKKVTKQAVYQALRKLKKEEVIVVFKKKVSLSQVWLDKTLTFFESANQLNNTKIKEPFLNLTEGDSITYSFKTPYLTDQFWAHAFLLLVATTSNKEPVCVYNPHEWFMITRQDSERALLKQIETYNRTGLFLIGHNDLIDREVKKYFSSNRLQYHASEKTGLPKNYYLNIFEDYILEVWIDKKVASEIDDWYSKTKDAASMDKEELIAIVHKLGRNKMRISRSKKRSFTLRKLFAKDFYIPKNKVV